MKVVLIRENILKLAWKKKFKKKKKKKKRDHKVKKNVPKKINILEIEYHFENKFIAKS